MSVHSVQNQFIADQETDTRNTEDCDDLFTSKKLLPPESEAEPCADIFSEEVCAVQSSISQAPPQTNNLQLKSNLMHSEELDLFAEATVELTLTMPNSRGRIEIIDSAGPPFSTINTHSSSHMSNTYNKPVEEVEEEESADKLELNIAVTSPERIGDGMNAYMTYNVSTQTTLPAFHNKTFSVRRRFSDFLGLYEKLAVKHNLLGCIIPPPPQKSVVGMTKVKVGKEDPSSDDFVEKRRAALERYLQRVVSHPVLQQDCNVQEFLEREELPRAVNTQALSGSGFLKMINKASDAVNKMTVKMNESDNWFESKLQEVENEQQLLRRLHVSVDSLVNHRKAKVEDKLQQLHQQQALSDFFIHTELLADYVRLLGAVQGCFEQRAKAWHRWQEAQSTLQKKREAEAKLLWANKPEKLQQAKEEIAEEFDRDEDLSIRLGNPIHLDQSPEIPREKLRRRRSVFVHQQKWEARVNQCERDFERISSTLKKEVYRFEKNKCRDFKHHIVKYLESLLCLQHQMVKCWEAFLPEAKAIM
ncbi:sorting nexin-1-like isoform X2 [Hemibagrus wyckioides]|uniref:sorting nexin-1-like isoform X2 n=1 Tax=Hemibagrus wyckioides TaxID=337641 RepID=UPI00266D7140|nr:sorting nexin-1-like isoform X2 [Hemibagrus wyckioides]